MAAARSRMTALATRHTRRRVRERAISSRDRTVVAARTTIQTNGTNVQRAPTPFGGWWLTRPHPPGNVTERATRQNRGVDLDLVFLGTAGSMPTARRSPTALLLRRGGDRLLIDCAEGTQRQLMSSNVGLIELREIFLTHYHADHYLGLPGMLKTFALRGREVPITIYGPPGLRDLFDALRRIFGRLTYTVELKELRPGDELIREDYRLITFAVAHGVSAIGYALVEDPRPGRFDVQAADALGIPAGPERGALQRGESVTLPDGQVITSDKVLGPPRPGRKVVIAGDGGPRSE